MRKVILYIATSIDGFISDENGSVDFLHQFSPSPNLEKLYTDFYSNIDTVIMGNNTYQQIITELSPNEWVYPNAKTYVYSSKEIGNGVNDTITFTKEDPNELINTLKADTTSKNIWLLGGASIIKSFLENNLIDEYIISIAPVILSNGIKLFDNIGDMPKLHLKNTNVADNFVELTYVHSV